MALSLDSLNLAQQEAVNHLHGPCLVLAGAGSGKTRVITYKIARLMQLGAAPGRIAAITFTNKAAREMRDRARALAGRAAQEVVICTFHALGVRMLRQDGQALGLQRNFSILDSDDVLALLKDIGATTDKALARQWQWQISAWKNAGLDADAAQAAAQDAEDAHVARLMREMQARLAAFQAVDFDDLITLPLRLLQQHEDVRMRWQQALEHVLVDEYQDTNTIQYQLLQLLTGERARFTVVGDDDQSIYGWRGATLDNLRHLSVDHPQLKVIKLEQNYRSTQAILQAANRVIASNPKLFQKSLWSELGAGEPVRTQECMHEEHEAERVVARIQGQRANTQHKAWKDYAVLYRTNYQSRALEQELRKAQIPYRVAGGIGFFDRAEIKDLCAWLRLLANPNDDPAFLRAITTPKRGIGHQTLQQLGTFAASFRISLFEALFAPSLPSMLSARAMAGLQDFGRYVNDLEYRARHTHGHEAATAFLTEWLEDIGYQTFLLEQEEQEKLAVARWGHVLDFCQWLAARCGGQMEEDGSAQMSEEKTLLEVVQTVALLSTLSAREGDQDVVTLSTLHAAKGLEWPHVILAGVNEGQLPLVRGQGEDSAASPVEEERRLMYVGVTRAQHSLMVTWSQKRRRGKDWEALQPSRFVAEMALDPGTTREDPRAKLKALREEFAARAAQSAADNAAPRGGRA